MDTGVHQLSELATLRAKVLEQNDRLNQLQNVEIPRLRGLEPAAAQARKERDGAVAKQKAAEQSAAAARRTADNANRRARAAEARSQELEAALARYDQAVASAVRVRDLLGGAE